MTAPPGTWQQAFVTRIERRTDTLSSFYLHAPVARHVAGQHVDVRLTAPDGYQARRSYSIASAPGDEDLELAIDLLPDGEVSGYFHDVAQPGDAIEVRGPLGGHFVWDAAQPGPVLLIGGGSGVVPLVSIARAWRGAGGPVPALLVHSGRTWEGLAFRDDLADIAINHPGFQYETIVTRGAAPQGATRRLDAALLDELLKTWGHTPSVCYVCGANPFVEAAAQLLVARGVSPRAVRTERYGG